MASPSHALAAGGHGATPEAPAQAAKDYTMPWGVVILFLVLGLILVCRPAKRSDEFKREKEEE
jgi:hypothetical protein